MTATARTHLRAVTFTGVENLQPGDVIDSIGTRIASSGTDHGVSWSYVVRCPSDETRVRSWDAGYEIHVRDHDPACGLVMVSGKPCLLDIGHRGAHDTGPGPSGAAA